jgi:ADP-ribose pyrophosphatase YjhB (NUDIX family)
LLEDDLTTPNLKLRTDLVDVYVFRRGGVDAVPRFLQMYRRKDPLAETWQPVMGHLEAWETGAQGALRELEEETGLTREHLSLINFWALEQVHPYYVASLDAVVLSPRFAAEVSEDWEPVLSAEHGYARWVAQESVNESFMWPGQRAAIAEILFDLIPHGSASRDVLKIDHKVVKR